MRLRKITFSCLNTTSIPDMLFSFYALGIIFYPFGLCFQQNSPFLYGVIWCKMLSDDYFLIMFLNLGLNEDKQAFAPKVTFLHVKTSQINENFQSSQLFKVCSIAISTYLEWAQIGCGKKNLFYHNGKTSELVSCHLGLAWRVCVLHAL